MNKIFSKLFYNSLAKSSRGNLSITYTGLLHKHIMTSTTNFDRSKMKVEHARERNEFYIQLKDGDDDDSIAYLQYSYIKPDLVDLVHTVVPQEFRGHGIAKLLAQTVFDHFVEKGTYIKPTCTYLQKFYKENQLPKYKEKILLDDIKL